MLLEDADEALVHQRLAAQDAEELGAVAPDLVDDAVELLRRELLTPARRHPATATGEVACLGHRYHVEGREERFAAFLPLLEQVHIPQIRPAEIQYELPQQPYWGLEEHSPAGFQ